MLIGPQVTLAAIVVVTAGALAWGRSRADVVAVLALLAAVLGGAVPAAGMLAGFGQAPVLAMAGLGVLAAGLRGSGVLVAPVRTLTPVLHRVSAQIAILGAIGGVLATFAGRAGSLAAFLPVPGQVLRARQWPSPASVPVAMAIVLGGMVTPLGTATGLIVAAGSGLTVPDFARVGGPLALGGLGVLLLGWRLAPRWAREAAQASVQDAYVSEIHVPPGSPAVGRTLGALARGGVSIGARAVIREEFRRLPARSSLMIEAGDVLVLACDTDTLQRVIEQVRGSIAGAAVDDQNGGVVEAVVTAGSRLVGQSAADGRLGAAQIGLLGVGRTGGLPVMRLSRIKLRAGDTLVLQGDLERMPASLSALGVLKLAERQLRLGRTRRALVPLAAGVGVLAALAWGVPLALAVLGGVAVVVVAGNVPAGELYDGVDWQLVVTVGALLPVGWAIGTTGLAASVAAGLTGMVVLPGWGWVAATLGLALLGGAVNAAAAAVLLVPCAGALAAAIGMPPGPLLLAVAVGAACSLRGLGGRRLSWLLAGYVWVAGVALIGLSWRI